MIRKVCPEDATAIAEIYNHYIQNSVITFETDLLIAADIAERIARTTAKYPYLVYELQGKVVGYAYAGEFRSRCAYQQTWESSVYLHPQHTGKGIGKELYSRLIALAKEADCHVMIGGITLPNAQSERLHEAFGFVKAAHFHEVGRKFDQWLDVGFYELRM